MRVYGFSQRGMTHIKKNIVCQDAHYYRCEDDLCVAAVADGLGSETHSDVASGIASKISVDYCFERVMNVESDDMVISIIKRSFEEALVKVNERIIEDDGDRLQYDTTLSVCVLRKGKLFFGHSGDSGIIALAEDGVFYKVTEQQRDDEGRVFPLCFGTDYWSFGIFKKKVAGVILATDGLLDLFYPVYLRKMEPQIYCALALFFLNIKLIQNDSFDFEQYTEKRFNYVYDIPGTIVDDDKTLVGVIDETAQVHWQTDDYYKEPDWNLLKHNYRLEYNKKAYSQVLDTNVGSIFQGSPEEKMKDTDGSNNAEKNTDDWMG